MCIRDSPCDECHGQRLSPESLAVTVGGINISAFCDKSVTCLLYTSRCV